MQIVSGQRRLALVVVAMLAGVWLCRADVFDNFCQEAVGAMIYNNKLFTEAQAGFSLTHDEVCSSTMLNSCQKMKSVAMLEELASFRNLPPKAQDAIRGGVQAYDNMVDEWAHFYWDVGRRASQKEFREGKNLVVNVMSFWEHQPGYARIYADMRRERLEADKVIRALEKDLAEIRDRSHEYSPAVLSSGNLLGKRLQQAPKKWPLSRDDLIFWNIPKVYGVEWLKPDFQLTDEFKRNGAMLDEFAGMVQEMSKSARIVGAAYSAWQDIANNAVRMAPKVAQLADSRFAQDNLTADFRETMEDAAETLLEYHKLMISQINSVGYRQLDECMNFLDSEPGKELAGKGGPLYKGTMGSTKEISRTFMLLGKQMADLYDRVAAIGTPSTIEAFCKAGLLTMRQNAEILDKCMSKFNLDNIRVCNSDAIDAFNATKKLKQLSEINEYLNLPPKSREVLKEVVDAYDHMLVGFVDFYQQVALDAKNDKFVAAKTNQAVIVHDWFNSPKNWQEKYRKMLEARKKTETIMQQFKKDIEEVKRRINEPNPRSLSSSNVLGNAIKKEPQYWPIRDSDMARWKLQWLYHLDWMSEKGEIASSMRSELREFDEYAQKLRKLPEYQETLKKTFTRWNEKGRLLATYGSPVARAAGSRFAVESLQQAFVKELESASKLPETHHKRIMEQLNGKLGFKLLDDTTKLLGTDGAREMINHNGLLYRGISTTKSVSDTYFELGRKVRELYQDAAK